MRQFEDSDDEDSDEQGEDIMADTDKGELQAHVPTTETLEETTEAGGILSETYDMDFSGDMDEDPYMNQSSGAEDEAPRSVRPKLSHPSSPRTTPSLIERGRGGSFTMTSLFSAGYTRSQRTLSLPS